MKTIAPVSHRPFDPAVHGPLHPAEKYARPWDVLGDEKLTRAEKRAILSSWASDACALDSVPAYRKPPGAPAPVSFDDIIDALKALDDDEPPPRPGGRSMRHVSGPDQGPDLR